MEYITPTQAQDMSGLRLALTVAVPAPYSMSARAIFDIKHIEYVAVTQQGGGQNEELIAWTGHRNAPIAVFNNESPRTGWLEILNLAERLGSGPGLIPTDIEQRMQMVALTNELIGENGFIWQMRLIMLGLGGSQASAAAAKKNPMFADYGFSEEAKVQALLRAQTIMAKFTQHVSRQIEQHSHYLIGDSLTALDIYWAYFSQLLKTLPHEQCPMPVSLRQAYDASGKRLGDCPEQLIEQRDWIFAHHLKLPMDF